jgi:hypothetical protein
MICLVRQQTSKNVFEKAGFEVVSYLEVSDPRQRLMCFPALLAPDREETHMPYDIRLI